MSQTVTALADYAERAELASSVAFPRVQDTFARQSEIPLPMGHDIVSIRPNARDDAALTIFRSPRSR